VPKSQDFHILPEVLYVFAGQQEIIILMSDFVTRTTEMALPTLVGHVVKSYLEGKFKTFFMNVSIE
jgi:hypothetical protein